MEYISWQLAEMKAANAYIKWNEALLNSFFSNQEGNQRVDVTNDILNKIGNDHGLGNANDFLSIVCVPKDARGRIYNCVRRQLGLSPSNFRVPSNIWECAEKLYVEDLEKDKKGQSLYFNYIVLLMYIAHEYIAQPDKDSTITGLGEYIKEYIRKEIGEESNYASVEELFLQLSKDKPQFGCATLTNQRYVGLIRFQLGLTQRQQTELYRALYKCEDLYGRTYEEQCDALKIYASENLKKVLNREDLKPLLSEQIEIFDRDVYRDVYMNLYSDEKKEVSRDVCVLAISIDASSDPTFTLVLLTNITDRNISGKDDKGYTFLVRNCDYTYGPYNSNLVLINGSEQVRCQEYKLGGHVEPLGIDNVAFFQEIESVQNQDREFVVQTKKLVAKKHAYAIVRKLKRGDVDKHVKVWEDHPCFKDNGFVKITSGDSLQLFNNLFGEDWAFYSTSDELCENCTQYYDIQIPQANIKKQKDCYGFVGGIPFETKKYLFNALPYLKLPVEEGQKIQEKDVRCEVRFGGQPMERGKEYRVLLQKDLLFIDLSASEESDTYSKALEIKVEYQQKTYTENIWVRRVAVAHDQSALIRYNQWGQIMDVNVCLQGSIINGVEYESISKINSLINTGLEDILIGQNSSRFYLITLLSAYCYLMKDHKITHSMFVKCVQYVCTRFQLPPIDDNNEISKLADFLTTAGYMNVEYTLSSKRYQLVPPSLIEVPLGWDRHAFLLSGAYTYTFLNDLTKFCKENSISIKVKTLDYDTVDSAIKQILPPTILVHSYVKSKIELFKEKYPQHSSITLISDVDYPRTLIKFCKGIEQFEKTLEQVGSIASVDDALFVPTYIKHFPQVRIMADTIIPNSAQYILTEDLKYYKSSVSDISYLWLYASYKRGESPLVARSSGGNVQIGLRDRRLPYLFRRAIYLMGLELMHNKKVFVINSNNTQKPLYEDMAMCQIDDDTDLIRINALIKKISPNHIFKQSRVRVSGSIYRRRVNNKLDMVGDKRPKWFIELVTKDGVRIFATSHNVADNSYPILLKYEDGTYTSSEANLNRAISNALLEINLGKAGFCRTFDYSYTVVEEWIQSDNYTQEPLEIFEELTTK